MWSVKVGKTEDGKLYTAGIGVGVENTPEGMQSQVLFLADRLAFLNMKNGVVSTPFAIDGGQTFINSGFIKDGSITNAKIGEAITSNDWVWDTDPSKTQGWAIDKRGAAWFNSVYIRGHVDAQSGSFSGSVYANKGELNNVVINDTCVIKGKLSAANIEGNVVEGNSFSFELIHTNANRVIRYNGNPLMPMRVYGYVMALMYNNQKTNIFFNHNESTAVRGLQLAKSGDRGFTYTVMFPFSRDIAKGETLDINVHAGALNQGSGESTQYTVMLWATPSTNGFNIL
jgi:predicted phage tail protein